MRYFVLLALALSQSHAYADTTKDALKAFGIVGTWSPNCAIDPSKSCERTGTCNYRIIYSVPFFGSPNRTSVIATLNDNKPITTKEDIGTAEQITTDKLRYTYVLQNAFANGVDWTPQKGEAWEVVLQKVGPKLRVVENRRIDGEKLVVMNGFVYTHVNRTPPWQNTGVSTPPLEKCL